MLAAMAGAPLKDTVVGLFSRLTAEDDSVLDELRGYYAEDVRFEDPVQKVQGIEPFIALNVGFAPDRPGERREESSC